MSINGKPRGEETQRVKMVVQSEMRTVKRIQFWVTIGLVVAGGGFLAAMYLNRYASASDVEKINDTVTAKVEKLRDNLHDKSDDIMKTLNSHIASETSRLGAVELQGKNIEEDYHQVADQVFWIAHTVGAREIPQPKHRHAVITNP